MNGCKITVTDCNGREVETIMETGNFAGNGLQWQVEERLRELNVKYGERYYIFKSYAYDR